MIIKDPLLARLFESFSAPRAAMRKGLDEQWSERERLAMVAAGGAMEALPLAFILRMGGGPPLLAQMHEQSLGLYYMAFALSAFIRYGFVSLAIYRLGKRFGGRASFAECRSATAWWSLVTALLAPLSLAPGGGLAFFALIATLALLTAYASETHGFANALKVGAFVAGAALVLMALLGALLGGLLPAP